MRTLSFIVGIALAAGGCADSDRPAGNVAAPKAQGTAAADTDNSAVNQRDRDAAVKTPLDQNENKTDLAVTAAIRKRVVDTKMSVNAQNVKIITQDGKVTLRGPVKTADEKKQIEDIARDVAGSTNVDSQIDIEKQP